MNEQLLFEQMLDLYASQRQADKQQRIRCQRGEHDLLATASPGVVVCRLCRTLEVCLWCGLTLPHGACVVVCSKHVGAVQCQARQQLTVEAGTLTFYNGLFTPQSIAQGTVFTGSDGIQVVTDASVTIPANTPPVDGQATVWAHTVLAGHNGNIAAGDITATIGNGVLVKNNPFRGGLDERTFAVVTKEDIQQVIAQLTPRLLQSEQAALTAQLQAGEQLFSPACTPTTNTDHQPGEEATHVKITLSETCTDGAYNQQAMQVQGEELLNEQARTLGKGYHLVGDIHPTLLAKQATATIRVQFTGTYLYQISQQQLTTLIAGQPKHHALLLLARMAGIQHITITGITDDTPIPLDLAHIHFQVFIGL